MVIRRYSQISPRIFTRQKYRIIFEWLQVISSLQVKRRADALASSPLILDAEDLVLNKLSVDGLELSARSVLFPLPSLLNIE